MDWIEFIDFDLDYHNEILTGSFSSSMIEMGGEARKRQGSFIWTDFV